MCEIISTAKPQIDGGTVKGIAIMTKERSKALPDVPTALEQGLPNLEAYTWNAIFLPKGAAPEIVKKLHDATVEAMKTPKVRDSLEGLGAVGRATECPLLTVRGAASSWLPLRPVRHLSGGESA
jgi:tripartite-type tricarboxylate transporter receptor subunit TctC